MADPNDIFNVNNSYDPFGPYRRHEEKLEDIAGVKVGTRQIHIEQVDQNGMRQVFAQSQYLCQGCGRTYVIISHTGSIVDNNILCERCRLKVRLKWLLKPLWSLFVKTENEKKG